MAGAGRPIKGGPIMTTLINIKELSKRLSIAVGMLYNWASQRRIPFVKVGRCLRFDWDEVQEKLLGLKRS
jgi:excisionase family DNA binding protein